MRRLNFSTPNILMRSIFFDIFISVRGVCVRACLCVYVWGERSGDSECDVEFWLGKCENSVKRDIMQV